VLPTSIVWVEQPAKSTHNVTPEMRRFGFIVMSSARLSVAAPEKVSAISTIKPSVADFTLFGHRG
jgi:hypothetical protein